LDQQVLAGLRERYDAAVSAGIIHNRLRDWHDGNHPATPSAPGCAAIKSSYLHSAAAHGVSALDAISGALAGKPLATAAPRAGLTPDHGPP
jgi:hypothetical protein